MNNRKAYFEKMTIRELRIYGRKNGITIYQKWNKPELLSAVLSAKT